MKVGWKDKARIAKASITKAGIAKAQAKREGMGGKQGKKRKKGLLRKAFLVLCLSLLCLSVGTLRARADFGDFSGDSDYGGSDDGGSFFSDSDSDGGELTLVGGIVWFIIILLLVYGTRHKKASGASETPDDMLSPMAEYRRLDPAFNEAAFRERLANLYVQMQQCWHMRNIESLKPYFTDAFYAQSDRQLEQKRQSQQTPCTERVAVLEVAPKGFYQSGGTMGAGIGMDHIVVRIRARIVDYTIDDRTGKVVSGDPRREKFMTYEWDLCRRSGVRTTPAGGMQSIVCPHCGAPLNINQTAKCPYCGSVVTVVNEDWALNNIKGIAQQTR